METFLRYHANSNDNIALVRSWCYNNFQLTHLREKLEKR